MLSIGFLIGVAPVIIHFWFSLTNHFWIPPLFWKPPYEGLINAPSLRKAGGNGTSLSLALVFFVFWGISILPSSKNVVQSRKKWAFPLAIGLPGYPNSCMMLHGFCEQENPIYKSMMTWGTPMTMETPISPAPGIPGWVAVLATGDARLWTHAASGGGALADIASGSFLGTIHR